MDNPSDVTRFVEAAINYCETFRREGHSTLAVAQHNYLLERFDDLKGTSPAQVRGSS